MNPGHVSGRDLFFIGSYKIYMRCNAANSGRIPSIFIICEKIVLIKTQELNRTLSPLIEQ